MDILEFFVNAPLVVKIFIGFFTLFPSALGGGSLVLHFKQKKKHSTCPLYPDMLKRDRIKDKIKDIKEKVTLREQMNSLASANAKIMFIIRSEYLKLTSNERDIDHYDKTLLKAKDEIKDNVRRWFNENHYTSKTPTEFTVYKAEKKTDMFDIVAYHLNISHKNNWYEVTREDLLEHNKLFVIPQALIIWDKMFDDCREIARNNEKTVANLEKELNANV